MIKGTRNQLHNISNPYQGTEKKVLTVCSAGILRSATLQNFLIKNYGYNVRNCGTESSYALIPISEALVLWADEIVFVNRDNYMDVKINLEELNISKDKIFVLDIPDIYSFNHPSLLAIIEEQYKSKKSEQERLDEIKDE